MTKDELEKEAEEYAIENWEHYEEGQTDYKALKQAYLDSAESREKRIADLEKENLYYKDTIETNTAEWEEQGKRVVTLEKENTKLKTDYEVLSCSVGDFGELQNKLEEEQRKNNGLSDNLIKAKELLAKWVELYKPKSNTALPTPIQVDTEQFLKDLEK